jgi:hypothetical protein
LPKIYGRKRRFFFVSSEILINLINSLKIYQSRSVTNKIIWVHEMNKQNNMMNGKTMNYLFSARLKIKREVRNE